ncbi:hypothetical protein MYIN104542_15645 [Mycobacterium intermedium]
MHSFMNNTPLEYSPATFNVLAAQVARVWTVGGLSDPWLML